MFLERTNYFSHILRQAASKNGMTTFFTFFHFFSCVTINFIVT
nr:MAG TPA: hypothetical protein [Caudoviricetes sp.]